MGDFAPLGVDSVSPAETLFYAYVHETQGLGYRYILTFSSADASMRWWDAAQKLSGHDQPAQYWTRPSAQLFAFQNTGHNNPLQLWEHQDMIDFRPHCMFSQIPDGGDRNPFSTIPVQWEDGYEVGSKYVHTIQAHIPGQGGDNEKAKDAEKEAAKQAENARKYRDELRKEGKPVRW